MFKLKSKDGSKCATVQEEESAEKLRATLESKNIKTYVDEIDDEYLISWE